MESWEGHHKSKLIAEWGPPQNISSDGLGGEVYVYASQVEWQTQGNGRVDAWGNITYNAPQRQGYTRSRMFYINPEGIIYSWRWQGL
jgi:hypothetical protein